MFYFVLLQIKDHELIFNLQIRLLFLKLANLDRIPTLALTAPSVFSFISFHIIRRLSLMCLNVDFFLNLAQLTQ